MNPIRWLRTKQLRYYKAMMTLTQDDWLHASESPNAGEMYQLYLYYKGKYGRLDRKLTRKKQPPL